MPQEPLRTEVNLFAWKSKSVPYFQKKKLNKNDKISTMLLFFIVKVINKV